MVLGMRGADPHRDLFALDRLFSQTTATYTDSGFPVSADCGRETAGGEVSEAA